MASQAKAVPGLSPAGIPPSPRMACRPPAAGPLQAWRASPVDCSLAALPGAVFRFSRSGRWQRLRRGHRCGVTSRRRLRDFNRWTICFAAGPDGEALHTVNAESCATVIITTSPVQSNPSTTYIEAVLASFALVPALAGVRRLLVCDGVRETETQTAKRGFRGGWVTPEGARRYADYRARLRKLASDGEGDWRNTEVLELERRQGFGFAVRAALDHVDTELVLVQQHDRFFRRPLDLLPALRALRADERINSVYLATASVSSYPSRMRMRFRDIDVSEHAKKPAGCGLPGIGLLPMLVWLDSTHVAKTSWYRDFVFGHDPQLVAKGGFIEDKFGQQQIVDLHRDGFSSHARYGTYLLPEPDDEGGPWVEHRSGRAFIEGAQLAERIAASRRSDSRRSAAAVP